MSPFVAAATAIDAVFGEPVLYSGAGISYETIRVIWSDVAGQAFQGAGNTVRTIGCEIRKSQLPGEPSADDVIERFAANDRGDFGDPDDYGAGRDCAPISWRPIEIVDRADVDAWWLTLEQVA